MCVFVSTGEILLCSLVRAIMAPDLTPEQKVLYLVSRLDTLPKCCIEQCHVKKALTSFDYNKSVKSMSFVVFFYIQVKGQISI